MDKVIHGRVGVSDQVRQRIQKILDEFGYEPNMVGRALQKQHKTFHFAAVLLRVDALEEIQGGIERALLHYNNFKIDMKYYLVNFPKVVLERGFFAQLRARALNEYKLFAALLGEGMMGLEAKELSYVLEMKDIVK